MNLKITPIRSNAIRNAARGQECTLQILGVCNRDKETTVLAHLPDESHGLARKSDDLAACFACDACHAVIDGRAKWPPMELEYRDWYFRRAMVRTWRILFDMGILNIKGAKAA